jgi:hypothetical protein
MKYTLKSSALLLALGGIMAAAPAMAGTMTFKMTRTGTQQVSDVFNRYFGTVSPGVSFRYDYSGANRNGLGSEWSLAFKSESSAGRPSLTIPLAGTDASAMTKGSYWLQFDLLLKAKTPAPLKRSFLSKPDGINGLDLSLRESDGKLEFVTGPLQRPISIVSSRAIPVGKWVNVVIRKTQGNPADSDPARRRTVYDLFYNDFSVGGGLVRLGSAQEGARAGVSGDGPLEFHNTAGPLSRDEIQIDNLLINW